MAGAGGNIAVAKLRAFVERIERVEEDIRELNADKSDIYKELRGEGFDVKAVRAVVAKRKLDDADRQERDAIFDLYWAALSGAPRVHVHEDEEFPVSSADSGGTFATAPAASAHTKIPAPIPQPVPPQAADQTEAVVTSSPAVSVAPIPDADVPAFLKPAKPLRPHCLNPSLCAGSGRQHCHQCTKAANLAEAAA